MNSRSLLQTIHGNSPDLLAQVEAFIEAGDRLDEIMGDDESPLRAASNNGRFEVVRRLLEAGAPEYQLEWTDTAHEVIHGSLRSLENRLSSTSCSELEIRDWWERTPFLLALQAGEIAKVELLLHHGANRNAVGHCGKTALQHAAHSNQLEMLGWLTANGFDLEAVDESGDTALMFAVKAGYAPATRKLLELGATIAVTSEEGLPFIHNAANVETARVLCEYGEDISGLQNDVHAELVGIRYRSLPEVSREDYLAARFREFGHHNAEETNKPLWLAMIRSGATAWQANEHFRADSENDFPKWCYERFGRSTTLMPDGRIIEIAGEHEDFYDPNFCIYNDVAVFDGKGGMRIYSYPEDVFPPTDSHTATLVEDHLYIIGNLGYPAQRRPGFTPVYRLDTHTMLIERLVTTGTMPGWISRHRARFVAGQGIVVYGGKCIVTSASGKEDYIANTGTYCLDLETKIWMAKDDIIDCSNKQIRY
jgi:ankyrin repeat protein